MNCEFSQIEWIDFHFASLTPLKRTAFEKHLFDCRHCLNGYLSLKAELDGSTPHQESPSLFVKKRIFADFEKNARASHPSYRFMRPLVGGFAAFATLLIFFVSSAHDTSQNLEESKKLEQHATDSVFIDSGKVIPESIHRL